MPFDPVSYDPTASMQETEKLPSSSFSAKNRSVRFDSSVTVASSNVHPNTNTHRVNQGVASFDSCPDSPETGLDFKPKDFTTYQTNYFKKTLQPWAKAVPYIQPLHEASTTNSILPHNAMPAKLQPMTTNNFGGKSATMLMQSAERLPAHLRPPHEAVLEYERTQLQSRYKTTNSAIGAFVQDQFGAKDSLSMTRKEIAEAKKQQTQRLAEEAVRERTVDAHTAHGRSVCKSKDFTMLLAVNDAQGGHVHSTAAAKRREQALEQRYCDEARYALDVHTHTEHGLVEEVRREAPNTGGADAGAGFGRSGLGQKAGSSSTGYTRTLTTRATVAPLARTSTLRHTLPAVVNRTHPPLGTVVLPGVKEHSIYRATACDCEPSFHDKVVCKHGLHPATTYPAGLHSTDASVARLRSTKSTVPTAAERQDAWHCAAADRAAYSLSLATAKQQYRKSAGPGLLAPPVAQSIASERETQFRKELYPPEFQGYNLIKTNLSMPHVYASKYTSEAHETLAKPGFGADFSCRHGKFGYLPKVNGHAPKK